MTEELKKVRKGTKSCTECRRRKVRCTWSSDEAPICRRCEERGSHCVAQVYSVRSSNIKKLSSKDRIARLERQVTTLSRALQSEGHTEAGSIGPLDSVGIDHEDGSDSDGSDFGSISSDGFTREPPVHLSSLFENDLLSSDTPRQDQQQIHPSKAVLHLSNVVRRKLQELIPLKEEVEIIAPYAVQWLSLFHALFPAPSIIKTSQDMVESYEIASSASVSPAFLASWLLSIAMTIQQVPKDQLGPESKLRGFENATRFGKVVSDAVEATIMRHDVLLGTMQGMDAGLLYLRLELSKGNFKKTWLQLRRVIAVAELMGLHRAARRAEAPALTTNNGNVWEDDIQQANTSKAAIWESLCSVDRVAGMLFNLPTGTRRYRMPQYKHILENGSLSLRAYLCSLSEIAMKVQDLDDLEIGENADAELYSHVLMIDGELRSLASVTPASWWHNPTHKAEQMLQFWHFYITIRAHLPFTLRRDTIEQFSFSRLACMKACQTLIGRYRGFRASIPPGFFVARIADLQAFTALVVLTLASHAASPAERANLYTQGTQSPELLISEAIEYMKTIMNEPSSLFARRAVEAVTSLTRLLNDEGSADAPEELKVKVPLLGKLHVRRKRHWNETLQYHHNSSSPPYDSSRLGKSTHSLTTGSTSSIAGSNTPFSGPQDNYPWDPFSWSIEDDQVGNFQDAIMMEDFGPFGQWSDQNGMDMSMMSGIDMQWPQNPHNGAYMN